MLINLIDSLSEEESKAFISYLRKKNRRTDTKNETLFKWVRTKKSTTDLDLHLYGKSNRNAYHALSNRLQNALIDFIALRSFNTDTSEDIALLKRVLSARILYERQLPKIAQKLLAKSAVKAQELELYSILNEILHTQIQYAHLHPELDLNLLTSQFARNQQLFVQQENLNLAYAYIKENLSYGEDTLTRDYKQTILDTLSKFDIDLYSQLSFKSLYQLLELLNRSAHLTSDFAGMLSLFNLLYQQVEGREKGQDKHRFYHIQVLYFMANAHFRNRQFLTCSEFLDLMRSEMIKDQGRYNNRFQEDYLLLYSLYLNYTGQATLAIRTITDAFEHQSKLKQNSDLLVSLVVFYMQQEQYKKALTTLNQLKHSDSWYESREGTDWLIRKDLLELIIHYELENSSLVDSLLRRFKRKYENAIKTEERLAYFLKAYEEFLKQPRASRSSFFRESTKELFTKSLLHEDLFMISYFAWIKSKTDRKPLYETTLSLL